MKTTIKLLLSAMMIAFGCSSTNAQFSYTNSLAGATVIYSNAFTGGAVDINGTAPAYINPNAFSLGGTNAALFDVVTNSAVNGNYAYQNGTLGPKLNSVILPFTPVSGYVYTLSATLTFTVTPPAGGWGGLGFAAHFPPSNSSVADPRLGSASMGGNPWTQLNMLANGGGALLYAPNGTLQGSVPNLMTAVNTPYTINLILDTTSTHWQTALYVNGTFVKGYAYSSNPSVLSFGYTQTTTTAGAFKWGPLTLSALPLLIGQQPVSASVSAGAAFTNTVLVAAATPSYQWYDNNAPIANATNASLIFNPVTVANSGTNYYVVITNSFGSVTSSVASLTVYTNPVFAAAYPVAYTNPITLFGGTNVGGTNYSGSSPVFSVSVLGGLPLTYQWLTNGVAVGGATGTSFTFTNCQLSSPTNFACIVSNSYAMATNAWSVAYVQAPLAPYPAALLATQPLGYWRLNEAEVDDAGDNGVLALDYGCGNNGIYTNVYLGNAGYSPVTDPNETSVQFGPGPDSDAFAVQGIDFAAPTNTSARFSVSAWVNNGISVEPANAGIVAKGNGGAEEFALYVNGGYQFLVRDAAGGLHTVTTTITPNGTWQHIVGVCDEANSNLTIYVNGVARASTVIAPGSGVLGTGAGVPMTIGAKSSSSTAGHNDQQYRGYMDDVAVHNYALSTAQVVGLYGASGNSIPVSFVQQPPTNFVWRAGTTLTIPATAYGAPIIGYYWTNLTTGGILGSGTTNAVQNLNATLTIPNASTNLSGDQLELVITNATSSTNCLVTLFCQPPPVTLDYSSPILYSNYFNGGTLSIAGAPLTAANALVGGTNTTWDVVTNNPAQGYAAYGDGTLGAMLNSVILPFTPHSGYVYTLSASLTYTVAPPAGGWGGLGFATELPTNYVTDPRLGAIGGNGWALLNLNANGGGALLNANGASQGGMPNLMTALNTPYDIKLVLDTTGGQWSVALYVADTFVTNYVYAAGNPNILSFGYTQTTTTAGAFKWNYITLTQEAPGGAPPYLLNPPPPTSVTVGADTSLSIPVTAFSSSVPVGYYWSNTNTAAVLGSGATNSVDPLIANLSVADVPGTWNGSTLALIVTNAYGTNISLVSLTVTNATVIPTTKPTITGFSLVGGTNVMLSATNGQSGGTYYLLGTTNLTTPLSQWLPLATNVIVTNASTAGGFTFNGTNVIRVSNPQQFYILSNTN